MNGRLAAALLATGVIAIAGCGGDDDDDSTAASSTDGTATTGTASSGGGELFSQTAHSGSLTPVKGQTDFFTLTLDDSVDVTSFTDRPIRSAGTETVADFVDNWAARGFEQDPPNAALVLDQEPDNADTSIFTLANPTFDQASGAVTYEATHITGGTASLPTDEHIDPPAKFGDTHLFIDPSGTSTVEFFIQANTTSKTARLTITLDPQFSVVVGGGNQLEYSSGGGGGNLNGSNLIQMTGGGTLDLQVTGGAAPITGTATVPSGEKVTVTVGSGQPTPLPSGKFSIGG